MADAPVGEDDSDDLPKPIGKKGNDQTDILRTTVQERTETDQIVLAYLITLSGRDVIFCRDRIPVVVNDPERILLMIFDQGPEFGDIVLPDPVELTCQLIERPRVRNLERMIIRLLKQFHIIPA